MEKKVLFSRIGFGAVALLAVALVAAMLYTRHLKRRAVPDYRVNIALSGLTSEVTVYRDRYAVPHVFAKNDPDLYRAVGYIMAQDRLWQMDLIRRATQGRLSEIFGADLVDVDLMFRMLRIEEKSQSILAKIDPAVAVVLNAYCDGVNQYIRKNRDTLPMEFAVLGYEPDEWKPVHSVNLIGYMSWDLTMPWYIETVLNEVRKKAGDQRYRELIPDIEKTGSFIYARSGDFPAGDDMKYVFQDSMKKVRDLGLSVFNGSNNWAVSGAKSVTGKPLLSNDMHLGLNIPGVWYQMHQVVESGRGVPDEDLNVTGVVVPGQPLVVSGHNRNIAWGLTNVMIDDMDFFIEKVDPAKPDRYFYKGEWREMEVRTEKIRIKGGKVAERKIRFTAHGPVISEFKKISDRVITMHWVGNYPSNEVEGVYRLDRARNFGDFRDALRKFRAISQNFVYADIWGNVGIQLGGGVPVRKKGDGVEYAPGETDEYEWNGFVPFEELPMLYNPPNGMVLSANNKSTSNGYRHYISHWYYPPYRYDRIKEMLTKKEKLGVDDFVRMHNDRESVMARNMKKRIVEVLGRSGTLGDRDRESLEIIKKWDCRLEPDSVAASIFERFYVEFVIATFKDEMGQELFGKFSNQDYAMAYAVEQVWANPASLWHDDVTTKDRKETADEILVKSFRAAVSWLEKNYSANTRRWQWGSMHTLTLQHPLGSVWILDKLYGLNRGPYPVGGSFHTVSPYHYELDKSFDAFAGASQRHAYDISNWDNSLSVIPTGNSGLPGSVNYCDQTALYVGGRTHPDPFSKDMVKKHATHVMKFTVK